MDHSCRRSLVARKCPELRNYRGKARTARQCLSILHARNLANAYRYCMQETSRLQCKYIAFSLLSCGVFRGNVDLEVCITIGLQGIIAFLQHDSKKGYPTTICFVAYTVDEQDALKRAIQKVDLSPLVQKTDGT